MLLPNENVALSGIGGGDFALADDSPFNEQTVVTKDDGMFVF